MNHRRATLVVVEDDEHVRRALARFLSSRDFSIETFDSAEAALAGMGAADAAILDINLPGMSGLELDERLHHEGRAIPTVFITAHQLPETARTGQVTLQKPFDPEALLEAIEQVLATRGAGVVEGAS